LIWVRFTACLQARASTSFPRRTGFGDTGGIGFTVMMPALDMDHAYFKPTQAGIHEDHAQKDLIRSIIRSLIQEKLLTNLLTN